MAPAPVVLSSEISRPRLASMVVAPGPCSDGSGWVTVGSGRCARPQRPQDGRHSMSSRFKLLLLRKAWGKCFKCLSPDHRVAECRNLAKCLLCDGSGHKARWCPTFRRPDPSPPPVAQAPARSPAATSVVGPAAVAAGTVAGARPRPLEAPMVRAEDRPAVAVAAAPRSAIIAEIDRDLSRRAVVAAAVGICRTGAWLISRGVSLVSFRFRRSGWRCPC
jgi:hypothetical protein